METAQSPFIGSQLINLFYIYDSPGLRSTRLKRPDDFPYFIEPKVEIRQFRHWDSKHVDLKGVEVYNFEVGLVVGELCFCNFNAVLSNLDTNASSDVTLSTLIMTLTQVLGKYRRVNA